MPHADAAPVHEPGDLHVCALHVRAVRADAREADFVCSTAAVDAYGEVVEQSWDLTRYLANPVVLFAHQSRELPIGQAKNVGVIDGALQATIAFSDAHQMARDVWALVQERTLRAVSVGFNPRDVRLEKRDGEDVYVLGNNELFEISVTPIPANPECLAKMRARVLTAAKDNPPADERGGAQQEKSMDPKEKIAALEADVTKREAEARVLEKQVAEVRQEKAALEQQNAHLVTERDAAMVRATAAEGKLVERDVDDLVGKKILPAEREAFVELAKSNRPLFEKMVAQRSDLKLLGAPVVGQDPTPPAAKDPAADAGAELAELAEKDAN